MDQPQLIDAQHQVVTRLGGLTRVWRFDRMATVVHPGTGKVTTSYAAVAKHYPLTELVRVDDALFSRSLLDLGAWQVTRSMAP